MAEPSLELAIAFSSGLVFIHKRNQAVKLHLQCAPKNNP